jgi:hypothetical protein
LGVDEIDFKEPTNPKIKTIAFNHRGQSYMGFNWFVSSMEKLWKIRKDFRVVTFQKDADCSKYEWADYQKPQSSKNREDYFNKLQSCFIGVGCFDGSKGSGGASWSIGVTDGLSLGVPYVLPNKYVWPKLMGDDYPLLFEHKNEDSFITMISNVMDDKKLYNSARKKFEPILKKMVWNKQVKNWLDWDNLFDASTFKMVGSETKTYNDVLNIIKKRKRVSKKQLIGELNWGKQFKFGRYRNRLRLDSNIRFTSDGYEWLG